MWALGLFISTTAGPQLQSHSKPFLIGAEWQDNASQAVKDLFWETGCNFARLTGGGFGWISESHKHALKELDDHGVRVLLQLGSHYPDGKYFDFKDAYFVDQNGKTGIPSKQSWAVEYDGSAWPQYSYASERFKSALESDFTAYFKALGPLTNVEAVMVHNEPGFHWLDKRIFDYNPASIERFRDWLPIQYGNIAALNGAWGSSFPSFSSVEPPHTVPTVQGLAPWMDWRRSNMEVIGDFLDWERVITRKLYPSLPVTTNLSGPIDNWYPFRLGDNYRFSRSMDIASIDIYPGSEWTTRYIPAYSMDMTRGAANGKPVYVAECESYAPEHFPQLSDEQRAARLASDLWTYIGHGANGVLVWTLNGQDGFKLTKGEYNARIRTLRDIAHTSKMLDLGAFAKPARKVAVVIDPASYLMVGAKEGLREWAGRMSRIALCLYGALVDAHIEADVISADMLRHSGVANRYKALVFAGVTTMDRSLAASITAFAHSGGLVVSDSSIATFDERGKACAKQPGFGLDRLFNAKQPLKGKTHLIEPNDKFWAAETGDPDLSVAMANWLKLDAGISPDLNIHGDGIQDTSKLIDPKGNVLQVITCPQNKAEPEKPNQSITVDLPKLTGRTESFLVAPRTTSEDMALTGPILISTPKLTVTNLESHAVVLTARDHPPLIATECRRSWPHDSLVTVEVTVYNPSPRLLEGSLELTEPAGWKRALTTNISLPAFGTKTFTATVTSGRPTLRAVLYAAMFYNGKSIESIPFDVTVR